MALGDLLLDVVVTSERPIEPGTDVPGTVHFRRGGSAANVAVAFAGLGGRAAFVGSVGRDAIGSKLVRALRDAGVAAHAVRVDLPTARLMDLIDGTGERSFVTERGAADQLRASDLRAGWFRGAGALHVPGYSLYHAPVSDAATAAVAMARANGTLVSVDLSSRAPMLANGRERTWELLGRLAPDILFANASEASALTGAGDASELLGVAGAAVVKEGPHGCLVLWRIPGRAGTVGRLQVATVPIAAADTTGAGDAFAAGFIGELLRSAERPLPMARSSGGARPPGAARDDAADHATDYATGHAWGPALARRAAQAGHASAARLLSQPRTDLEM